MKTPERKSVTRLRAPKPMATPATPALASSGARLIWSTESTVRAAVPMITKDATLRSTEPMASERCRRRSALTSRPPSAVPSTAWAVRFMRAISLVMPRRISDRSTTAITMIRMMRRPLPSQVDQFSSTQPAALFAVCVASSREVTRCGVVSAARTADQDTAGTLRVGHARREHGADSQPE